MPRLTNPTNSAPLDFPGLAVAPPLAPAGSARMYFDSGLGMLLASLSGGAYADVMAGGGATFPLLAPTPGVAAAPDYSFAGDTDTGRFSDVAGAIVDAADAVEVTRLTATLWSLSKALATKAASPAALAAGNNNNFNLPDAAFVRFTTTAPGSVVTGFTGGVDGRHLYFVNLGAVTLTLNNQDVASAPGNRIITVTGAPQIVNVGGRAFLLYDSTTARWRVMFVV